LPTTGAFLSLSCPLPTTRRPIIFALVDSVDYIILLQLGQNLPEGRKTVVIRIRDISPSPKKLAVQPDERNWPAVQALRSR
jgi:hypothetical protein